MKRVLLLALMFGAVSAAVLNAQTKSGATTEDAVMQADHALVNALEKGDTVTINKLLDPDFSWIDTDGIMWAREDALRAGLKPLVPVSPDVKYTEHKYGKVVWIQDNLDNKYAAHFWVQRAGDARPMGVEDFASIGAAGEAARLSARPGPEESPGFGRVARGRNPVRRNRG